MPVEQNEVSITVGTKRFIGWTDFTAELHLDALDSIRVEAPFSVANPKFRSVFKPFGFQPIQVRVNRVLIFNGTVIGIEPKGNKDASGVAITAYAIPGVLDDCHAPGSAVPLEFKKLGLVAIAKALAAPFTVNVTLDGDADEGAAFKKAKLDREQKIFEFLTNLAQQRGLVLTNSTDGELLCWRPTKTGKPVATLRDGEPPVTNVEARYNPQEYFSELTGFASKKRKKNASKFTAKNTFLSGVLRPRNVSLEDTDPADTPVAVRAKLGRMFANACSVDVELATWRDPQGDRFAPNSTIILKAPDQMIYSDYEFLIRTVTLRGTSSSLDSQLNLVLPGSFDGVIPSSLPWDG